MFDNTAVKGSISGVATLNKIYTSGHKIQILCTNITVGNGVVTIKVKYSGDDEFRDIDGENTIDLNNPIGLIIEGKFSGIKAISSDPSDVFDLQVYS